MGGESKESELIEKNPATIEQITPQGKGVVVLDLVLQDFKDRAELGQQRYGEKLKTFNGRSALTDLFQELMDAVMYTRQLIEEEKTPKKCEWCGHE